MFPGNARREFQTRVWISSSFISLFPPFPCPAPLGTQHSFFFKMRREFPVLIQREQIYPRNWDFSGREGTEWEENHGMFCFSSVFMAKSHFSLWEQLSDHKNQELPLKSSFYFKSQLEKAIWGHEGESWCCSFLLAHSW